MNNRGLAVLLSVLMLSAAGMSRADGVDDIVALSQKGVGDDVIIASIEQSKTNYTLSAGEIIRLKDAKISDKVITAMLRHKPGAPAVAVQPAPRVAAPVPAPAAQEKMVIAPAAGFGILNIENLDDKTWSYSFEPAAKTLWISTASADGKGNLTGHAGLSLRMPTGNFKIRYNGMDFGPDVTVFADDKSLVMLSRVDTAELEALYATVFERGERSSSQRLVTLRENAAPRAKRTEVGEVNNEPRVAEHVQFTDPAPTVAYTQPVYYGNYYPYYGYGSYPAAYVSSYAYPRYCAPYYSSYCGPRYGGYGYGGYGYGSSFGFGYSQHGSHSSWGVGVGLGFRH
jgi:hypothetical protein